MRCRICDNEENNQIFTFREIHLGNGTAFPYFQCAKCLCLQILEFPSDPAQNYSADYYIRATTPKNYLKKMIIYLRNQYILSGQGFIGRILEARYPNPALRALSRLSLAKSAHILDVGCGRGSFLANLRLMGYNNLLGIDPFYCFSGTTNALPIQSKTIYDIDEDWDMIVFNHSFEHISDPEDTLRRVHRLLKPKAHCLIRIPLISSFAWEHYRENWVQLDAPRHLFLHSRESMRILLEKTGFTLTDLVYDSTSFQFWGSEQYLRGIPLRDRRSYARNPGQSIFKKKDIARFARRAEELNAREAGDQAVFYLCPV